MRYKIGICGYFASGKNDFGGQPVKTNNLLNELRQIYGPSTIDYVDTINWKKRKLVLFFDLLRMTVMSRNIIILPAANGIKVFGMFFNYINNFMFPKRQLHYVVIGGWLPALLEKNKKLIKMLKQYSGIYVETLTMKNRMCALGFSNVYIMRNFKNLASYKNYYELSQGFKFCFFARVIPLKGIEEAISAIKFINNKYPEKNCTLDIYGPIDENYVYKINNLLDDETIKYRGVIDTNKSSEILKDYYIQLFPTKFFTEGIPGSIIDSFFSGLPVIASKWESFSDVIIEGYNGFGYTFDSFDGLVDCILWTTNNPDFVLKMRKNCVETSVNYLPINSIKVLVEKIK